MGWGGAGERGDWTVPSSSLVAKQSLSSRSLHPIPCPWPGNSAFACKMNRGKKEKKKAKKKSQRPPAFCKGLFALLPSGSLRNPQLPAPSSSPQPCEGRDVGSSLPLPGRSDARGGGSLQEQQQAGQNSTEHPPAAIPTTGAWGPLDKAERRVPHRIPQPQHLGRVTKPAVLGGSGHSPCHQPVRGRALFAPGKCTELRTYSRNSLDYF